jgi:hypothetical protein
MSTDDLVVLEMGHEMDRLEALSEERRQWIEEHQWLPMGPFEHDYCVGGCGALEPKHHPGCSVPHLILD